MKQETSLSNTICFVIEFFRHHLIEISQFTLFKNLCMQAGYTIDRKACHDRHIRHADLALIKNRHASNLIILIRITFLYLDEEATIDLLHDLINSWKETHK